MQLIIGLGNPGTEYEKTRHNVGFMVLDNFDKDEVWKLEKKFNAKIVKRKNGKQNIIFAKPQTFMNNSGETVQKMCAFYKIKPKNILVIHDEIDLPLGTIKLSFDNSSAGHNGVQSIIDHLGTKEFWRLRIGIGHQKGTSENFVLKPFGKTEAVLLKKVLLRAAEAVNSILKDGPAKAQNSINAY